jgi:alkylmercury lyase
MAEDCCSDDLLSADLGEAALEIGRLGFAALWRGEAMVLPDLTVARHLVARGRAEVDDEGRLVGIHGLTLRPTRHRFVTSERSYQTWCAFDAVGIPAAMGVHATAYTDCPACGQALTVTPDEPSVVLWLPGGTCDNLMVDFCARADLYCNREHLDRVRAGDDGQALTLTEAAALGRQTWADVAPDPS